MQTEWVQPKRHDGYFTHPNMVEHITLEEYAPKFAEFFTFRRENHILEVKMHHKGGPAVWSAQLHRAIPQMLMYVNQDLDNEVLIFGGTGSDYIAGMDTETCMDEEANRHWMLYDVMYHDGPWLCENLVNLDIPTIGVINGPGFHTEMAMFCDATLVADNGYVIDPHMKAGMVPSDGIQIAFRVCMGYKRANYALWNSQKIDGPTMVEWGAANECLPADKVYDRAWELAREWMEYTRVCRRVTVKVLRAPLRQALATELHNAFGSEMMVTAIDHSSHSNDVWEEMTGE